MQRRQRLRYATAAALLAAGVSLGGCGGIDGIEVNGSIFDWLGVSPAAQESRKSEPKLADRPPLVIPPDVNRLPDPGSGHQSTAAMVWPNDPEQRKVRDAQERERLHLAYCNGEMQWKEKALDPQKPGVNRSPYGPCPGLFSGATTTINKQ